ncbi:unnamed protein product, partial [Brenthis ino]
MRVKTIFTLLGVAFFQTPCICVDQSGFEGNTQPMIVKERRDTPEVVLQLKYDGGELNKIYLTQFRKESNPIPTTVPTRASLCADLCHSGLGGSVCGSTCQDMLPVGLESALSNVNRTDEQYGYPRVNVCPVLCANGLGQPLCNCQNEISTEDVDWSAVCGIFCNVEKYVLQGCPVCDDANKQQIQLAHLRVLNTIEGWQSWCNLQCRQGQGGAACNCDRPPFL